MATAKSLLIDLESLKGMSCRQAASLLRRFADEGATIWDHNPLTQLQRGFEAGILIRRSLEDQLRWRLEESGLDFTLRKSKGLLFTDFLLIIRLGGAWEDVHKAAEIFQWLAEFTDQNSV